jgi:hypothetical protein
VLNAYPQFTCIDRSRPAGRIVQSIISGDDLDRLREFLSEWEVNELQVAKVGAALENFETKMLH